MTSFDPALVKRARDWMATAALPLWTERGLDPDGGFIENLSFEAKPQPGAKRVMVQARQIYSYRIAHELKLLPGDRARKIAVGGARFMARAYSLPTGAVVHSVSSAGRHENTMSDLYGQAFALFGLANAYALEKDTAFVERAKSLVRYLKAERSVPAGGYTEVKTGKPTYESNPHMHLFEAVLAWAEVHDDPLWKTLSNEVLDLCLNRFIDRDTGLLAEFFDSEWKPLRSAAGTFVWEPGHQYEWSWLMGRAERILKRDVGETRRKLFTHSENHGIWRERGIAYDEMWSDFTPKLRSSRFWPQCERIKAAVSLRETRAADEAVTALFRYLDTPVPGLWFDRWMEDGSFPRDVPAKSSSLYHIIGALAEYVRG